MNAIDQHESALDRRSFFKVFAAMGLASTLLPQALCAAAQGKNVITPEMMAQAEKIAGLEFSVQQRAEVVDRLNRTRRVLRALRDFKLDHETPLPLCFNPLPPGKTMTVETRPSQPGRITVAQPARMEDIAFWPVTHLAQWIKDRRISSVDLTRMYRDRLKKYGPRLKCVVRLTEELAFKQAARADREIASGIYRGPLHGIPWGVKDLFATKGIPTSWGVEQYRDRVIDTDATVVKSLAKSGAVLLAKLALGELATGDRWYGGQTRNPWNPARGSGGSSAGSASAVAAGLVGFSIGTETNESLVGPALLCGVSGLRPTFGRVSRYGAMTVSWSYDKIGPMCRSAEDCALVLEAIHGPDPKDRTAIEVPFHWDARSDLQNLRVGYVPALLAAKPENEWMAAVLAAHQAALQTIADMGVPLIPLKHIDHDRIASLVRVSSLGMMVEAAAAHEELALHEQGRAFRHSDWAKRLRAARYIPAVDYVQANRARMLLMEEIAPIFETIDVLVGRNTLSALQSNLTGHPELVIPHGLDRSGMPVGIILTGKLFGEAELTRLAHAYQMKTDYHRIHPDL